ncbi:uncharacterized protein [Oscarella lobularis]
MQELKLREIRKAKEEMSSVMNERKLELEAVRDIVKYRDKRYRDLLTGSVDFDEQVKPVLGFGPPVGISEDREQIFRDVLDQHEKKFEETLEQLNEKEKDWKEQRRKMGRRRLQCTDVRGVEKVVAELPRDKQKLHVLKKEVLEWQEKKVFSGGVLEYHGEFDIRSYEDWQIMDYHMVRDLLLELVDQAMDQVTLVGFDAIDIKTQEIIWENERRKLEREKRLLSMHKEAQAILYEIIDKEMPAFCKEIVTEVIDAFAMSEKIVFSLFIETSESVASHGNAHNPGLHQLVQNSYKEMTKSRKRKHDIYRHSLSSWIGTGMQTQIRQSGPEIEDEDVTLIEFLGITSPTKVISEIYREAEMDYWEQCKSLVSWIQLPDHARGISVSKTDYIDRYIALGSLLGDIFILDFYYQPPRIVRHQTAQIQASIINLAWSQDSSRILTIDSLGFLRLWSLAHSADRVLQKKDALGTVGQLNNLLTLSPENFLFVEGPFSGTSQRKETLPFPVIGNFVPGFSLLGTQSQFVIALNNGSILKITDTNRPIHVNEKQQEKAYRIGKQLRAILFKGHKSRVILLEHLRLNNEMLSLDEGGNLMYWKREKSCQTGYGWFVPVRKCRIDWNERVFKPSFGSSPKIEFSDVRKLAGKKKQTLQQLATRRSQAMEAIRDEELSTVPWHSDRTGNFVVHIYAPPVVPESGKTFHIVTYHKSNGELSEYATQLYKPEKSAASKILDSHLNPSTQDLAIMLLFPSFKPRPPHISIVVLNLRSPSLPPTCIDVSLTEQQFLDCMESSSCCSFQVSRVLALTQSDYVFVNFFGTLRAYSIASGTLVICNPEEADEELRSRGCQLSHRQSFLRKSSLMSLGHHNGGTLILSHSQNGTHVRVLELRELNTIDGRRATWRATEQGKLEGLTNCPKEFQARSLHWTMDQLLLTNPEFYCRCLLEEIIDEIATDFDDDNDDNERRSQTPANSVPK